MDPNSMVAAVPVQVDETDPLVFLLAWGLTYAAGRLCKGRTQKLRRALPAIAVMLAVVLRVLWAIWSNEGLSLATFLRAMGAAGTAVLCHSQLREILKAVVDEEASGARDDGPRESGPPT